MTKTLTEIANGKYDCDDPELEGYWEAIDDVKEAIKERIAILETNNCNKLTKHKDDDAVDEALSEIVERIMSCQTEEEAKEIIPEIIELGRKEELIRLLGQ